jgi:hypothetical protein
MGLDAEMQANSTGLWVVLTNIHRSNRTDFLLGRPTYVGLAKPGMSPFGMEELSEEKFETSY